MTFLTLRSIRKTYDGVVALEDIDLSVPAGSRTVIVGPSASGKTTLLRIIAGFDAPDAGVVTLDDRVLADADGMIPAYRRGIGYVAQDGALFPHLTVEANIGFGLELLGTARHERILELLDMVELPPSILPRRPDQLSGGQQQRVAIARALAQQPRLMLLDEPFSALDAGLRDATRKAVGKMLRCAGVTTILVTHDQQEALTFADQVAVLHRGRLAQVGAPREVYERPASAAVASYLGDAIVLDANVADGYADCALGRVAVLSGSLRGAGRLMLRPEQVRVAETDPGSNATTLTASGAVGGEVVDVDYAGAHSTATVRIARRSRECLIVVKLMGRQPPSLGDNVQLCVDGIAHLLPSDTGAEQL